MLKTGARSAVEIEGWVGSCDVATSLRWFGGGRWRAWGRAWWVCGGRKGKEDVPDPARPTGTARAVLSDYGETTQLARRLDAFVLLAETAFGPAGSLPSRSAETALSGLLAHLNANRGIYTERYLGWIDKHHGVEALVPIFNNVFSNIHAVSTYLPAPPTKDPPQRW